MKNILLIGGSYGIGLAIAEALQYETNLFIASRSFDASLELRATHIQFDALTDALDLTLLPNEIHGLVYLPGSINLRPFKGIKPEAFDADWQINFMSMVRVLQSLLPKLTAAEQSSIVLYSTVAVQLGMPFHTSVAASKGAIEGFARAFAAEYAPKIRMNVIAPSLTDTPLADKFLNSDEKKEKAAQRNPMKKVGTPQDIAQATLFLLNNSSNWMTGQILHVDGGMSTLSLQI
mgnify:CR=1 FL=1